MNDLNRPDLEGELRNHYQTMGVGSSRELVARTSAAIDRAPTRRSPRLVPLGWLRLPTLPRRTAVAALAIVALVVLAVTAAPLWFGQANPVGPASPIPTGSATPLPTSTLASIVPGHFTPDPSLQLAEASASALGRMRSGGAWMVMGEGFCTIADPTGDICRTPWPSSDTQPPAVFVLDKKHAWTITLGPGSVIRGQGLPWDHLTAVVNRTVDGGASWQAASVPGDYSNSQLAIAFTDPLAGYLIATPHDGASSATVLTTSDGGSSWRVVATVHLHDGSPGAELAASDGSTIWAGAQLEATINHPVLAVSRDRGRTWSEVTLPGLAGLWGGDGMIEALGPPVFVNPSVGFFTVRGLNSEAQVFGTRDGGRTWTRENMPAGLVLTNPTGYSNGLATVDFIDADRWVAATDSAILSTSDGGKTWTGGKPLGLPAGRFVKLVFLDPENGLGLFQPTDGTGSYLYRTWNGGISWQIGAV